MRAPRFPVYDPAKDGNIFQWIVAAAAKLYEHEALQRLKPTPPRYRKL